MDDSDIVRDIGIKNMHSMKDGVLFHNKRSHFYVWLSLLHVTHYDYIFRATPRKFKIHRSMHPYVFFGISLYLPYRFDAQLNTVFFSLTRSSNPIVNMLVRVPSKVAIYGTSIFLG